MDTLILNCFPVELSPTSLTLPFKEFASWDESSHGLNEKFRSYSTYRHPTEDGHIRLVFFNGPDHCDSADLAEIDLGRFANLASRLIERSLNRHFQSLGIEVTSDSFGSTALRRQPNVSRNGIDLRTGIGFQARRPFRDEPYVFLLSAQWEARAFFKESLAAQEPIVKNLSLGLPVIYRPTTEPPADLLPFRDRYMGHVRELFASHEASIFCRDHHLRTLPLDVLFLEASSECIKTYENALGIREQKLSMLRSIQELSLVLTPSGRRNSAVLRDRLHSITAFLSGSSQDSLVVPMDTYQPGTVTVGLIPLRAQSDPP